MASPQAVRVGIGGWTYEPWRDNFYPDKLAHARELEYASRHMTAIEINGTYYGTQKPATFARWRDETPDGFVFSLKASRYATNRRERASAGESIGRFLGSGISELGVKLGPIVWQFSPTKRFESGDFEAFLALLPEKVDGIRLRHVLDVRHDSFMIAEFLALAHRYGVATVFTDSTDYPSFADLTADFVYARLMCAKPDEPNGYSKEALAAWAQRAALWARGEEPPDLPRLGGAADRSPRDVFVYFIDGAKERAPAAAMALLGELGLHPAT